MDRKASKDRKLKYDFHEKLINFMSSYDNLDETEDREQFLGNLFGVGPVKKLKTGEEEEESSEEQAQEGDDITLF